MAPEPLTSDRALGLYPDHRHNGVAYPTLKSYPSTSSTSSTSATTSASTTATTSSDGNSVRLNSSNHQPLSGNCDYSGESLPGTFTGQHLGNESRLSELP